MRILPVDTNRQSTNFTGAKIRKINISQHLRNDVNHEQSQNRNYIQAIMIALAFVAATLTKGFIDACNSKHKQSARAEVPAKDTTVHNTLQYKNE